VFKLKPGRQKVHPMCFSFPRENPAKLFFPILHIHDGTVHTHKEFDHDLYAQGNDPQMPAVLGWRVSDRLASPLMKTERTAGILQNNAHVYRTQLKGRLKNEDIPLDPA
jgi:hypothetical protein